MLVIDINFQASQVRTWQLFVKHIRRFLPSHFNCNCNICNFTELLTPDYVVYWQIYKTCIFEQFGQPQRSWVFLRSQIYWEVFIAKFVI